MTKLIDITHLLRPLERREYWRRKFWDEAAANREKVEQGKMTPEEFKKWKEQEMKRRVV